LEVKMSSKLLLLILLLPYAAVAQTGPTAEEALAKYRQLTAGVVADCDRVAPSQEIVVCAKGRSRYALPFPEERDPPDHARRPTGEIPSAAGSSPPCPIRGCPGGGKLLEGLAKVADAIVNRDD
jgi:hypothetical protein